MALVRGDLAAAERPRLAVAGEARVEDLEVAAGERVDLAGFHVGGVEVAVAGGFALEIDAVACPGLGSGIRQPAHDGAPESSVACDAGAGDPGFVVLAVEHRQVARFGVEPRDPAVLVVARPHFDDGVLAVATPVRPDGREIALGFCGVQLHALLLQVGGHVVRARQLVEVHLIRGVALEVLDVEGGGAALVAHLGAGAADVGVTRLVDVVHDLRKVGIGAIAQREGDEAPAGGPLQLLHVLVAIVVGGRRIGGSAVALASGLGLLLLVLLLAEVLEQLQLLLLQELLLLAAGALGAVPPAPEVRQLLDLAAREREGEEVIVCRVNDALPVHREAGVGLASPRVRELRDAVSRAVVHVEVARAGVHLALEISGVDVLAVVPAVEEGHRLAALGGRHLLGRPALAGHAVERVARKLPAGVPIEIEVLAVLAPAEVFRPVADPRFGRLHDLLHGQRRGLRVGRQAPAQEQTGKRDEAKNTGHNSERLVTGMTTLNLRRSARIFIWSPRPSKAFVILEPTPIRDPGRFARLFPQRSV